MLGSYDNRKSVKKIRVNLFFSFISPTLFLKMYLRRSRINTIKHPAGSWLSGQVPISRTCFCEKKKRLNQSNYKLATSTLQDIYKLESSFSPLRLVKHPFLYCPFLFFSTFTNHSLHHFLSLPFSLPIQPTICFFHTGLLS